MPLSLDRTSAASSSNSLEGLKGGTGVHAMSDCQLPTLTIGLVNNMQDGALETTECQFMSLLDAASEDVLIRLRLLQLPGIVRGEAATRHVAARYTETDTLLDEQLDGLIVTGREPSTVRLQDEPYWGAFVRLLEWAHDHTISTIWSCLGAHAAVLQMDGIPRVRSAHKHYGLFDCEVVSDHPLTSGMPSRFRLPHSRWNGLDENQLVKCGYELLTYSERVGIDAFVKQNGSLFVFFQGHPEYDANTLLLEYRRDIARYLRGETAAYPSLPQTYFDEDTTEALRDIGHEARLFPREELLSDVSAVLDKMNLQNPWYSTAISIYRNWVRYLAEAKKLPIHGSTGVSLPTDVSRAKPAIATTEPGFQVSPVALRSVQ
jgi:homoserine O-succinyltransferase